MHFHYRPMALAGMLIVATLGLQSSTSGSQRSDPPAAGQARALIGQGDKTLVYAYFKPTPGAGRQYSVASEITGGAADSAPGDKVAIAGFAETGAGTSDVWGGNFLASWRKGDPDSNVQGVEIDLNDMNADSGHHPAKIKAGLNLTSGGAYHPGYGMVLGATTRANAWRQGIVIPDGIVTDSGVNVGAEELSGAIVARQIVPNGDTLLLQRNADQGYAGDLIRGVDRANRTTLFRVRADGHVFTNRLNIDRLPVFDDNQAAIAGKLEKGEVFRTSKGQLMVRY